MIQQIQVGQTIWSQDGQEEYKIKSMLGQGAAGSVYLVELRTKQNPQQISQEAMKVQDKIDNNEIQIMETLMKNQSPNLLNIKKYWQSNGKVFIVMDLASEGSLFDFMEKNKDKLSSQIIEEMFFQLCLGVWQLHKLGIIHRDLKPENILLQKYPQTQKYILKICDYGLRKKTSNTSTMKIGTVYYMAPELIRNTGDYTKSIDIWALGCIWYSLVNNNDDLFTGFTQDEVLQKIKNETQPQIDNAIEKLKLNDWEKQLMKSMISIESSKRPAADQIIGQINKNKNVIKQPQNNQNQQGPIMIVNQPNAIQTIPQIPQNQQNILHIQPNQQNQVKIAPQIINTQPIQPNLVQINPQIPQSQIQQNLPNNQNQENQQLIKQLQQLQQEFNLIKQQVEDSNFKSSLRLNEVQKQQTDLQNLIFKEIKQLANQNINQKQQIVNQKQEIQQADNMEYLQNNHISIQQDIELQKQSVNQIKGLQKQIKLITNAIEKVKNNHDTLDQQIRKIQIANTQPNEPNLVQMNPSIPQSQIQQNLPNNQNQENQQLIKQLQQLQQEFNLIKQQVEDSNFKSNLRLNEVQKQQTDFIDQQLQKQASLQNEIKTLQNTINDQNLNQKLNFDKEILQQKQLLEQILNDKQIEKLQNDIADQIKNNQYLFDNTIKQLQSQNSEQISKQEKEIINLQQQIQQIPTTIDNRVRISIQQNNEEIQQLKQQFELIQTTDQQIKVLKQEMISISNKTNQQKVNDSNILQSTQQVEKQQNQDRLIEELQLKMNQLPITIESKTMNSIQQFDEEIQQLKKDREYILRSENQIKEIQQEIQQLPTILECKVKNMIQNDEQIKQSNYQTQKLKEQLNELAYTIENTKSTLEQNLEKVKQELLQQDKSILKQQEEIHAITNKIQNKHVNLESANFKEIEELKLQIAHLSKSEEQMKILQEQLKSNSNKNTDLYKNFNENSQQFKQQSESILKQDEQIKQLQEEMKQLPISIEKKTTITMQNYCQEIISLKQQIEELKKSQQSIETIQKDMKQLTNNFEQQNTNAQSNQDSNVIQLQQQSERISKQDQKILQLYQDMQQLSNTIDYTKDEFKQNQNSNIMYQQQQDQQIEKVQQDIQQLSNTIRNNKENQTQKNKEYNLNLQQKLDQIKQSEQQFQLTIQEIQFKINSLDSYIVDQQKDYESNIQYLKKQLGQSDLKLENLQQQQIKLFENKIDHTQYVPQQEQQLQQIPEQILEYDQKIQQLQNQMKELSDTNQSKIKISIQRLQEEFQQQQSNSTQKNQQQIEQLKNEIQSVNRKIEDQKIDQQKHNDLRIQQIKLNEDNDEKLLNFEKLIKQLQETMNQFPTHIETKTINLQKMGEEISQLQQQYQFMKTHDLQIKRLELEIKQSATTIEKTQKDLEQKHTQQIQQIDSLVKSNKSIENQQQQIQLLTKTIQTQNSNLKINLKTLNQELKQYQVSNRQKIDQQIQTLEQEMKQLLTTFENEIKMSYIPNSIDNKIHQQQDNHDQNTQYIQKFSEKIEKLQQGMIYLESQFENTINDSQIKMDRIIQEIKQQDNLQQQNQNQSFGEDITFLKNQFNQQLIYDQRVIQILYDEMKSIRNEEQKNYNDKKQIVNQVSEYFKIIKDMQSKSKYQIQLFQSEVNKLNQELLMLDKQFREFKSQSVKFRQVQDYSPQIFYSYLNTKYYTTPPKRYYDQTQRCEILTYYSRSVEINMKDSLLFQQQNDNKIKKQLVTPVNFQNQKQNNKQDLQQVHKSSASNSSPKTNNQNQK